MEELTRELGAHFGRIFADSFQATIEERLSTTKLAVSIPVAAKMFHQDPQRLREAVAAGELVKCGEAVLIEDVRDWFRRKGAAKRRMRRVS